MVQSAVHVEGEVSLAKFVFTVLALLLAVSLVAAILKGIVLLALVVIGLMLLVGLYRARPAAFFAVCVAGLVALMPPTAWPWAGFALLVWLVLELVRAARDRVRVQRGHELRLPRS